MEPGGGTHTSPEPSPVKHTSEIITTLEIEIRSQTVQQEKMKKNNNNQKTCDAVKQC